MNIEHSATTADQSVSSSVRLEQKNLSQLKNVLLFGNCLSLQFIQKSLPGMTENPFLRNINFQVKKIDRPFKSETWSNVSNLIEIICML